MKKLFLVIFVGVMNFIYLFMKMAPTKNQVTMISRQSDSKSLDFLMLEKALTEHGIKVIAISEKFRTRLFYIFHIWRHMRCIAASKMVVVDSYCIPVSILKHKKDLKVIQIWHAVSAIKQFGKQTVGRKEGSSYAVAKYMHMHENYDFIAAPSRITGRHFAEGFGYDEDKIVLLGLPRMDTIVSDEPEKIKEIKEHYHLNENGKKTILYVPTFRRTYRTDYMSLVSAIDRDRYDLLVRLHPLDRTPRIHFRGVQFPDEFSLYEMLKAGDIIISDYSSFVVESSVLDKPLYLYTYDIEKYKSLNGLNVDYSNEEIGKYQFRDPAELAEAIEKDYDFDALRRFNKKYIEIEVGKCTEKMAGFIDDQLRQSAREGKG